MAIFSNANLKTEVKKDYTCILASTFEFVFESFSTALNTNDFIFSLQNKHEMLENICLNTCDCGVAWLSTMDGSIYRHFWKIGNKTVSNALYAASKTMLCYVYNVWSLLAKSISNKKCLPSEVT